ncbi:MAG: YicC family protein [Pseudomonadales bacterium]|nr:YicC family protein [Pseudomonadales bacterium]
MTNSMTAFTRIESGNISWEIRSVNHRYLDTTFKIPETCRTVEPELRTILRNRLSRGKVDCFIRVNFDADVSNDLVIDEIQLRKLKTAIEQTNNILADSGSDNPIGQTVSVLDLLKWPGVLKDQEVDQSARNKQIIASFKTALDSLVAMRQREGAELEKIILSKLDQLEAIVQTVRADVPVITLSQKQKIEARLTELKVDVDKGRLEQELVYLAQKSDIAEEIDRLDTHIEEVRRTLQQSKAKGRRLDFLMQELNREANTLSSKAVAANTSIQSVELKVIIEQMREQVQNIV